MVVLEARAALEQVRAEGLALVRKAWSDLADLLDETLPNPIHPEALLPVATGLACGGRPADVISVAAAVLLGGISLRVLDDCADRDDAHGLAARLGVGRAANVAAGLSLIGLQGVARYGDLLKNAYITAYLDVCQGQDLDQPGAAVTLQSYTAIVEKKTVAAYRFAAEAGAYAAGASPETIARAGRCGSHLGWCQQILDDLEAWWFPGPTGEWDAGRLTWPALYAATLEHPLSQEVRRIVGGGPNVSREKLRAVLDAMEIRPRLLALALDHRDAALAELDPPQDPAGRSIVELMVDWLFRDADRFLAGSNAMGSARAATSSSGN